MLDWGLLCAVANGRGSSLWLKLHPDSQAIITTSPLQISPIVVQPESVGVGVSGTSGPLICAAPFIHEYHSLDRRGRCCDPVLIMFHQLLHNGSVTRGVRRPAKPPFPPPTGATDVARRRVARTTLFEPFEILRHSNQESYRKEKENSGSGRELGIWLPR